MSPERTIELEAWTAQRVSETPSPWSFLGSAGQTCVVLAGAFLLALAACSPSPRATKESPGQSSQASTPRVDPTAEAPAEKEESGALHVKVPAGSLLRTGPEPSAEAIEWLAEGGLYAVRERAGDAFHIEIPTKGQGQALAGWVRGEGLEMVRLSRTRLSPQPAPEPDAEILATAARFLRGGGRRDRCGPYILLTDAEDKAWPSLCDRLATGLDGAYASRFGVTPLGDAKGAVILFQKAEDFRAFAGEASGHAGHAHASEGYLALYVGERPRAELTTTLVHELAHLVHRRALGSPLPRWLSEGLADALGDPATPAGLGPSEGLRGAEVARRRVLERPDLPDLETLTHLAPDDFDAGPQARDYEQSAVFVRYLLSEAERSRAFRAFLEGIAAGEDADLETLIHHLAWPESEGPAELDQRLRRWLEGWRDATSS